jgi:D-alanine-D-alanine ligase-like ATP-grasp enzyme
MSGDEAAQWLLDRGIPPVGDTATLRAAVNAGLMAERAATAQAGMAEQQSTAPGLPEPDGTIGGIPREQLFDPAFEPGSLNVTQLREVLRCLNQPTAGRKAQLMSRLQELLDNNAIAAARFSGRGGPEVPPASQRSRGNSHTLGQPRSFARQDVDQDAWQVREERRVQSLVDGLQWEEVLAELRARGQDVVGSEMDVREQLALIMLVDRRRAIREGQRAAGMHFLDQQVARMSNEEIAGELQRLGITAEGLSRPELEGNLVTASWQVQARKEAQLRDLVDVEEEQEEGPKHQIFSSTYHMLTSLTQRLRVAVICGGPNRESPQSLASARTVVDALRTQPFPEQQEQLEAILYEGSHLEEIEILRSHGVSVEVYYIDRRLEAWRIPAAFVYCSSPLEFEPRLAEGAEALGPLSAMAEDIKQRCDIALPAVHGKLGEGGELQRVLESADVEYVGSQSGACERAFNKAYAREQLARAGFPVLEQHAISRADFQSRGKLLDEAQERLEAWTRSMEMDQEEGVTVVKPADGGGGLGIVVARGLSDIIAAADELVHSEMTEQVVIEPKVLGAVEFSVCVIQTPKGVIALPPSTVHTKDVEVELAEAERERHMNEIKQEVGHVPVTFVLDDEMPETVYDYRKKNLPLAEVCVEAPASLPAPAIQGIRRSAERAFVELGLRDFARFDGWLLIDAPAFVKEAMERFVIDGHRPYVNLPHEQELPGALPGVFHDRFYGGKSFTEADLTPEARVQIDSQMNEDIFYHYGRDRYVTASQLAAFEATEAETREEDAIFDGHLRGQQNGPPPLDWPLDPQKVLHGEFNAAIPLIMLPPTAYSLEPERLTALDAGALIFSEVNPFIGLQTCGPALQQAAAAGMSIRNFLRTLLNNGLSRLHRPPLPPEGEGGCLDPLTSVQLERFPQLQRIMNGEGQLTDAEIVELLVSAGHPGDTLFDIMRAAGGAPEPSAGKPSPAAESEPLALEGTGFEDELGGSSDEFDDVEAESTDSDDELDSDNELEGADDELDLHQATDGNASDDDISLSWAQAAAVAHIDREELPRGATATSSADADDVGLSGEQSAPATETGGQDAYKAAAGEPGAGAAELELPDGRGEALGDMIGILDDVGDESGMEALAEASGFDRDLRAQELQRLEEIIARVALSPAAVPRKKRQRIYILCGGDSAERHVSLMSAVSTWLHLRRSPDFEVTLFVVSPAHAGLQARERRQQLIKQRNALLGLGIREEELDPELSLTAIRHPEPPSLEPLGQRMVWAVPHALGLRSSVEDVVEACERLDRVRGTVPGELGSAARERRDLHLQISWELEVVGAVGVAASYEGLMEPQTTVCDFDVFVRSAQDSKAVVFNLVQGALGEDGSLQLVLEEAGVAFTGSHELAASACSNKIDTAEHVQELGRDGIHAIPLFEVSLKDLIRFVGKPDRFEPALVQVRDNLQLDPAAALCIKPACEGGSVGVMRIEEPEEFQVYATAILQEWPVVPAELVAGADAPLPMPTEPPALFVIQPFIASDRVLLKEGDDGSVHVKVVDVSGFVEVTVGLYGLCGAMHAMTPSVVVKDSDLLTHEEKFGVGAGATLTPIPASIAPPVVVQAAQGRAEVLANSMGVSGCARLDAFMSRQDGSLYVLEVNTVPPLLPGSPLFQQGLLESPPIYPEDFLRYQVLVALDRGNHQPLQDDADDEVSSGGQGDDFDFMFDEDQVHSTGDFKLDELDWIEAVS